MAKVEKTTVVINGQEFAKTVTGITISIDETWTKDDGSVARVWSVWENNEWHYGNFNSAREAFKAVQAYSKKKTPKGGVNITVITWEDDPVCEGFKVTNRTTKA